MINTTFAYSLPSPQQNLNFSISVNTLSSNVQVVSNQATMYALFQGNVPPPFVQKFRWIPTGTSWNDETPTELVNMVTICTFNFGSFALCTVQTL